MPTRVDITVDPDGGGDYTSLSAALAGQASVGQNLVTRDVYLVFTCTSSAGTSDTTTVSISGWTTTLNNRIIIRQDPDQPHLGDFNTSYYRIEPSSGTIFTLSSQNFVEFHGLQINQEDTSASTHHFFNFTNCSNTVVRDSYCVSNLGATGNTGATGINYLDNAAGSYLNICYNNIVFSRDGIYYQTNHASASSVFYHFNNGMWSSEFSGTRYGTRLVETAGSLTCVAKNTTAVNFGAFGGGADWSTSGTPSLTTATNATWDTSSPNGASYRNLLPAWEDIGNLDVNLKSTDTDMKDNGTDVTAESPVSITVDGRGAPRETGANFDIGPLEEGTDGTTDRNFIVYQPLTATASVQAPTVTATVTTTVTPSALTATASVQSPTVSQVTPGPTTYYNALPW